MYRAWGIDPRATFGTATAFIPESVKVAGALLLIALLLLSMRRTHVPGEWIWLRDRFSAVTGVRLTAKGLALWTCATVAVAYIGSGLFAVQPGEVGVRMRFGAIVSPALGPGLHYRLPWPFEAHRIIQKDRVQRIEFGFPGKSTKTVPARDPDRARLTAGGFRMPEAINTTGTWFQKESAPEEPFLLTGDGNLIDLRWAVQYRVKDAVEFAFNVAEPDAFVRGVSLAALRGVVARSGIDAIYTSERSDVERQVATRLQAMLDTRADRGRDPVVPVCSTCIRRRGPRRVPRRRQRAGRQAAHDQSGQHLRGGDGEPGQRRGGSHGRTGACLPGRSRSCMRRATRPAFCSGSSAYRRAPELTQFRLQVETIEATLPGLQKFVRPGAGDIKDFDMWLLQPVGVTRGK